MLGREGEHLGGETMGTSCVLEGKGVVEEREGQGSVSLWEQKDAEEPEGRRRI